MTQHNQDERAREAEQRAQDADREAVQSPGGVGRLNTSRGTPTGVPVGPPGGETSSSEPDRDEMGGPGTSDEA